MPGEYNMKFGLPYLYQGKSGEDEYLAEHSILCPSVFSVYAYLVDGHKQRGPGSPNFDIELWPNDEAFGKLNKNR